MNAPAPRVPQTLESEIPYESGALAVISKAEIDMQIATAHRFPRSLTKFREEAEAMVTLSEDIADECIYSLSRKDADGVDRPIEGPSSRFAEVIASAWGNCRAGARVISEEGDFVTAQGAFHDLERNVAISYEVKRRITNRSGRRYSADMVGVTANAACSIALRNAILKGVPKAFWAATYESAKRTLMGDYKTLTSRRTETLDRFKKLGVSPDKIYAKFGIKGEDDLSIELVFQLRTLLNAIKEGDTTPEEQFPAAAQPSERSAAAGLKGAVAGTAAGEKKPDVGDSQLKDLEKGTPAKAAEPPKAEGEKKAEGRPKGTLAVQEKYLGLFKEAKDQAALDDFANEAGIYEWTPEDLGVINKAYHARSEALKTPVHKKGEKKA